ncbi:hypothetical protein [Rhizobium mesosinicum]|uniref:Uncharacterized protein n=1 Tax=Rhizobium mesosinicum TaxID=335017 RepID=A0ABS7GS60_9HYPH|nr:hypothetical protein [Rhizobium mesosinicum]MBW9052168.1 hypothetical protein [Rhizobium mesosinicum]
MTVSPRTKFQKLYVLITWPFVMTAYRLRERRRFRKNFPLIWKTPGEITNLDLENYEPEDDDFKLDKKFVDDLLPTRDAARTNANRILFINMMIFAFLLTDYFSIGLTFTIPGVSVVDPKGVKDFLIFYSSMTGLYCFIIQNNMYTLDSAMKFVIMNKFPLELRGIYIAKYFYFENFPPPSPTQLPHISYSRIYSQFFMVASVAFLIAILIYFSCYAALYMAIAVDIWKNARLGIWSYVIAGASIANGVLSTSYLILTRIRMPYRDYTVLHEIQGLPQIAPSQYERRQKEVYGEGVADWLSLVERGYIKRKSDSKNPKPSES